MNTEKEEKTVWISAQEASEILLISKTYFLQLLRDKKLPIPCVRIGRAPKFRKKDVEDYFDSQFSNSYVKEDKEG